MAPPQEILDEAKKSGRSLNGELVHTIEQSLIQTKYMKTIKGVADAAALFAVDYALKSLQEKGMLTVFKPSALEGDIDAKFKALVPDDEKKP